MLERRFITPHYFTIGKLSRQNRSPQLDSGGAQCFNGLIMPVNRAPSSIPTVVSVIVLMLIIGYAVYQKIEDKTEPATTNPFNSIAYLTIAKQEEGHAPEYTLDIEYPEFKGLGQTKDDALNFLIATTVNSVIAAFKSDLAAAAMGSASGTPQSALSIRYKVEEASDKIVSIVFENSAYSAGAAHPNNFVSTFNYRVDTDSRFYIGDVFKKDSDYLTAIGPLARERLLANPQLAGAITSTWLSDGTAPREENFSAFSLTSQGLTLYFNPYQIAAYAAGVIAVSIPLSEIATIADPAGPVSQLGN